ncbi:DNA polymerase IV [Pseudoclavibacter chungangensis]|uniref:DNA polymerase IV n=1 Tax=Pseudoclavibacter chungangensis TaxID=587635 RepID=A0A7J5BTR6_9MICO|nr:DNA polymerase IV [Pseudoclavibacter chungangensis]KAB1656886.1 DNA polymerase IV [Pseudoclavibacter chungangensis]NYJ67353.1 DNA polymerase-4 [Pseudoclavibacter chungangensis]
MSRKDLGARRTSGAEVDDATATILHVDMDAFFVAVELLDRPELRGEPVIVGGAGGRGVVSSASYEARRFGVRSAMPMTRALQLCPNAVVIGGHMHKYREASERVMAIFRTITPLVEPLSIDEAFLDVSGATRLFGGPGEIGARIRERVVTETGLTCSVGAAATKFVAKLASGKCKPDGLLVVPEDDTIPFLHALPVGALWGVGEASEERLRSRGIRSVFDLAHTPKEALVRLVGRASGERLHDLAWGRDPRGVETERREKSVSHEQTFAVDEPDHAALEREIRAQADAVGARLRRAGLTARTVSIKLRWADFTTITRSKTLPEPTDLGRVLFRAAKELFDAAHDEGRPVRLIGVRAGELAEPGGSAALDLWGEAAGDEAWDAAERTVDRAVERFGPGVLRPASLLGRGERRDGREGLTERANSAGDAPAPKP